MKKITAGIAIAAALVLGMWWLKSSNDAAYDRYVESLYQQCQAENRAEFDRRQANAAKLEAVEAQTAAAYQGKIDDIATNADQRIAALNIKSNAALRQARASTEEVLQEKAKVHTALGEMTLCRDQLIFAAHTREKEIFAERRAMTTEITAAVAAKIEELDTCEKARRAALSNKNRRTWLSIGPASQLSFQDGTVQHRLGVSIQIPIVEIKSPFKRF